MLSLLVVGCASRPTPAPVSTQRHDPCRLSVDTARQLDTLTVALLEPVGLALDNAKSPSNDSERFLYRNLFDNLIRLDCDGTVRPGLAQSWTSDSDASWTFTLREGASFAPGWPVSASHVAGSVDSAVVLDARHLRVPMRGRDSIPRFLADPALAVLTGMASMGEEPGGIHLPAREGRPVVYFQFDPNGDGRDALDRGADLLVTRDPSLVDYVAGKPEFITFPLPWSRTYVLLQPTAAERLDLVWSDSARRSLAGDAVRAEARAAEPPYWWNDLTTCPTSSSTRSTPISSRIVYRADDEIARGIAERLVALARAGTPLRVAGLATAEFAQALGEGGERGYVIGLPRHSLAPCRDSSGWTLGSRIERLIDTRAYAIVRKGAPPLTVDWDGTVRVLEP